MNILTKLYVALTSEQEFKTSWKRLTHMTHGHPYDESTHLEKQTFEAHPHTDEDYIYTINLMKCNDCGLTWTDKGLEDRLSFDERMKKVREEMGLPEPKHKLY